MLIIHRFGNKKFIITQSLYNKNIVEKRPYNDLIKWSHAMNRKGCKNPGGQEVPQTKIARDSS